MSDDESGPGSNAHEYTVSELSGAVKRAVEDEFGYVRVRGEVGRLSRPGSGHLYFDLKDDKSVLAAVAWKGQASKWRFQPEQGLEVIATGRLTTFPGQSKYQIIVENVEPAGVGALMALLEERRKKLAAEGLFDEDKKQDIPYLPRVIGVVTSPSGAVIRDIIHRLEDRFPTHVIVWPVRVQGESCAPEVAAAVEGFNMIEPGGSIARPDLIIVARGGGSVEDLWGFNEEAVVRAISESEIPIISAIGHETDVTLSDFAADKRAPTPTGAAEMAVPVRGELIAYVDNLGSRQLNGLRTLYRSVRDRLRAASRGLPRPAEILSDVRQRVDLMISRLGAALGKSLNAKQVRAANSLGRLNGQLLRRRVLDAQTQVSRLSTRIAPALARSLDQRRRHLAQLEKLANSLSHESVLARGFALIKSSDGTLIRSSKSLSPGDQVHLQLADGQREATINGEAPVKPKPKRVAKTDDTQTSLF